MYATYQLMGMKLSPGEGWLEEGKRIERQNRDQVRKSLDSFLTPNGEIDAVKMMEEWFCGISADVFISHSRADKELALTLAGRLSNELQLSSFVDSCAWGHANQLLRGIDDACCKIGETTYSYYQSTITASHVHLMLGTALSQMLDRCECVFFLNSEHSLKSVSVRSMAKSDEEHVTQSPWLFHELSMLRLIRRREKDEHRLGQMKKADFSEARSVPTFNYPVSLVNMPVLSAVELDRWVTKWRSERGVDKIALDCLYDIKAPRCQKTVLQSLLGR